MGEYVADIHLAPVEMYRGDKPVFVAPYIEHDPITYLVCRRKSSTQFAEITKVSMLHHFEPTNKRRLAVCVLIPELTQRLSRDDMHQLIISHYEIWRNSLF